MDGAVGDRRGDDHPLRVRAGRVGELDLDGQRGRQIHGDRPDQRSDVHVPGAGRERPRRERAIDERIGHAEGHPVAAGRAGEPGRQSRQRVGDAQLGPAGRHRHALRVRAGRVGDLDLDAGHDQEPHGDRPDQRRSLPLPGAGGQQRRDGRGLRLAVGQAGAHAARRARGPGGRGRQRAGDADLDGAGVGRRAADHALRVRAGRGVGDDGEQGHPLHGERPDQRPDLHLPGAGRQRRRGEPALGVGAGHAGGHGGAPAERRRRRRRRRVWRVWPQPDGGRLRPQPGARDRAARRGPRRGDRDVVRRRDPLAGPQRRRRRRRRLRLRPHERRARRGARVPAR